MSGHKLRRFFKVEIAKRVLSKLSGYRSKGFCKDISTVVPTGPSTSSTRWSKWRNSPFGSAVPFQNPSKYFSSPNSQNSSSFYWNITRSFRRGRTTKETKPKSVQDQIIDSLPPLPPRYSMSDCYNLIFKPFAFTAFVGGASVVGCTIWQYEDYRKSIAQDRRLSLGNFRIPIPGASPPNRSSSNEFMQKFETWWASMSAGERLFWPICALNAAVYFAWRVPGLAPMMVRYFSATPVSRAVCWPMLLSTFSHYSFYHLAANMFVLHSFIPAAAAITGKENFVAMYLTSGVVASYGSHLHKLFIGSNIPSLGASGAIMGILGLVCTRMPDIQLGIIFLPGVQFSADTALKCILAVDIAGILAGWKFMDHAAHLGGCIFGIAFSYFGARPLGIIRDNVMTFWHNLRTNGINDR